MSFYIPEQKNESAQDNTNQVNHNSPEQSEFLTVSAKSQSTRNSTIMLVACFIIGVIGIFAGIRNTSPDTASAATVNNEDLQLEASIAAITGIKAKMTDQMDDIMKKFSEFSNVRQIDVDQLTKNPFKRSSAMGSFTEDQLEITGTLQEQQLKQIANSMQLLSIMESTNSPDQTCCMIEDKILYKGQSIKGFTITEITANSVKIKSGTFETELKLR